MACVIMSFLVPLNAGNINKRATIRISLVIFIIQFLGIGRCQSNAFQNVRLAASFSANELDEPTKRHAHIHHGLVTSHVYLSKVPPRNPHGLHTAADETYKRIDRLRHQCNNDYCAKSDF